MVDPWSYVKIDYGMSKESLTLGRENKYVVVYACFALLVESGIHFMAMVSYIFIWGIKLESDMLITGEMGRIYIFLHLYHFIIVARDYLPSD